MIQRKMFLLSAISIAVLMSCSSTGIDLPDDDSNTPPGRVFYVSLSTGSDLNDGLSNLHPFQTLTHLSTLEFLPGDKILLRAGERWTGQTFRPKGSGTATAPIEISAYGAGATSVIIATNTSVYGIQLINVAGYKISGLEFTGGYAGISTLYEESYDNDYLWIENCSFHDITDQWSGIPSGYYDLVYGAGINIYGMDGIGGRNILSNITITDCSFDRCDAGIQILGADDDKTTHRKLKISHEAFRNVNIRDCDVLRSYRSGGVMLYCINGGKAERVTVDQTGYNGVGMWWGVCAFQCARVKNYLVEDCVFSNTIQGTSPDGQGFDFEADNHDVTVRNCKFLNNDGPAILCYGDSWPGENTNCVVEGCYMEGNNISTNMTYDYYNKVFGIGKPANQGIVRDCIIKLRSAGQTFYCFPLVFDESNRVYDPDETLIYGGAPSRTNVLFCDDFENDLSKWQNMASAEISDGSVEVSPMRLIYTDADFTGDYFLETVLGSPISGGEMGIVLGYSDKNNYNILRIKVVNAFRSTLALNRISGGTETVQTVFSVSALRPEIEYPIRIEVEKGSVRVFINGNLIGTTQGIDAADGPAGLWQGAGSQMYAGYFHVYGI